MAGYGLTSLLLAGLPLLAAVAGVTVILAAVHRTHTLGQAVLPALLWTPAATLAALAVYAVATVACVRVLSIGLREGYHPVRSRSGWQLWTTERLMDAARQYLFPLYASQFTPVWLRILGATVGRGTEISTVLLTPKFTVIEDGAFLADDTMVASYELGADGSTRPARPWAAVRSSATRASPNRAVVFPTKDWSQCCRPLRRKPNAGRRGWAAHPCGCAGAPPRPRRRAPTLRRHDSRRRAPQSRSAGSYR